MDKTPKNGYVVDTSLSAIADAIREQNNEQTTYTPSEMPKAIQELANKNISDIQIASVEDNLGFTGEGLKVQKTKTVAKLGWDPEIRFVFNGGSSAD